MRGYITCSVRLVAATVLLAGAVGGLSPGAAAAAAAERAGVSVGTGVRQVVGDNEGYCALFTSGRVDC